MNALWTDLNGLLRGSWSHFFLQQTIVVRALSTFFGLTWLPFLTAKPCHLIERMHSGTANNAGAILVVGRGLVIVPKLIHPLPPPLQSPETSPERFVDDAWMQVTFALVGSVLFDFVLCSYRWSWKHGQEKFKKPQKHVILLIFYGKTVFKIFKASYSFAFLFPEKWVGLY